MRLHLSKCIWIWTKWRPMTKSLRLWRNTEKKRYSATARAVIMTGAGKKGIFTGISARSTSAEGCAGQGRRTPLQSSICATIMTSPAKHIPILRMSRLARCQSSIRIRNGYLSMTILYMLLHLTRFIPQTVTFIMMWKRQNVRKGNTSLWNRWICS